MIDGKRKKRNNRVVVDTRNILILILNWLDSSIFVGVTNIDEQWLVNEQWCIQQWYNNGLYRQYQHFQNLHLYK